MMGFMMISEFMDTVFSDKPMSIVNNFPQNLAVRNTQRVVPSWSARSFQQVLGHSQSRNPRDVGRIPKFHEIPCFAIHWLSVSIHMGEAGTFFPVFFHVVPYIFPYVFRSCFRMFPWFSNDFHRVSAFSEVFLCFFWGNFLHRHCPWCRPSAPTWRIPWPPPHRLATRPAVLCGRWWGWWYFANNGDIFIL